MYHFLFLGVDNQDLLDAFTNAQINKQYESVKRYNGEMQKHYALTDVKEYFAEGTEAYFGTNDFYPFINAELKKHDPILYKLLEKVWEKVSVSDI